jgi:hypothetical protein
MTLLITAIFISICFIRVVSNDNRRPYFALFWIGLAICGNVIFADYQPTQFQTKFGEFNATWAWGCFALALIESALNKSKGQIRKQAFGYQFLQFVYAALFIMGAISIGSGFRYSYVFVGVLTIVVIIVAPTFEDLDALRLVGVLASVFILYCLLSGYNPIPVDPITGRVIAGVDGLEYRNRLWDVFDLTSRFHGPFTHPNQLGIFSAFFATLLVSSQRKSFKLAGWLHILFLCCAVSRTSLLAALIGITISSGWFFKNSSSKTRNLAFISALVLSLLYMTLISDNSGTGRKQKFSEALSNYNWSLVYGPPGNYIENTFISTLYAAGLLGFAICVYLHLKPLSNFWDSDSKVARVAFAIAIQFFVASSGETVIGGSALDSGTFYLVFFTIALNSEIRDKKTVRQK